VVEACNESEVWSVDVAILGDTGVSDEAAEFVEAPESGGVVKDTMISGPCWLSCTRYSTEWMNLEAIVG
jgi:hypothetical protein